MTENGSHLTFVSIVKLSNFPAKKLSLSSPPPPTITMFSLTLDPGAALLGSAMAAFLQTACHNGEIFVSQDDVALVANSVAEPMFRTPSNVVALRLRPPTFRRFSCDRPIWLGIDLIRLQAALSQATPDDVLVISGDDEHNIDNLSILLLNSTTQESKEEEMDLVIPISPGLVDVREFQYEYQVIVGLPSERFRHIATYYNHYGSKATAIVYDTQVRFFKGNAREIVLMKELNECVIGGSVGRNPVYLRFGVHYLHAMRDAASRTNIVWLLGQTKSNGTSVMLNFSVGVLGNLMLYFNFK